MSNDHTRLADLYAAQAVETAARLKAGTWEAVHALATLSIAESLLAQRASGSPKD